MENTKVQRSSLRGLFTKALNEVKEEMSKRDALETAVLKRLMNRLEDRYVNLSKVDEEINQLMCKEDTSEYEWTVELEGVAGYRDKYSDMRSIIDEICEIKCGDDMSTKSGASESHRCSSKSTYKLPKLELRKFSGDPKDWLSFWSQFSGIHDNIDISLEDKYQYLIQATLERSSARSVVESFPPTAENYPKAIAHLKSRFGKDKLLIEIYVRDLLHLVLRKSVDKVRKNQEVTPALLKKSTYVDNCITSFDSETERQQFINDSTKLCAEAKFELRGWTGNRGQVGVVDVTGISSSECGLVTDNIICQDTSSVESVLGLLWHLSEDVFSVDLRKIVNYENEIIDKRRILSATHRIYDPIGFCLPITIVSRIIMQDVFKEGLKWNEEVPLELRNKFLVWYKGLVLLSSIKVPRWLLSPGSMNKTLHIFTDASKRAYAAVAFLRSENSNGVTVQLVMSRARVSTIKAITIPRLELVGCECGAKLANNIRKMDDLLDVKTYYWTDSSNALAWIKRHENWQMFVYNRVKTIRELSNHEDWYHIPGHLNPADLPSRGCSAEQLIRSRWWEGADWLREEEKEWPRSKIDWNENIIMGEAKKVVASHIVQVALELFASCVPHKFKSHNLKPARIQSYRYMQHFITQTRMSFAFNESIA